MQKLPSFKLSGCFCLFGLILLLAVPVSADDRSPFLYYYSADEKAFIVERADGSDRQVLAAYEPQNTLPEDVNIMGPGWSLSRNWFAWYSIAEGASEAYVVNREGTEVFPLMQQAGIIEKMSWVNDYDFLMVGLNTGDDYITYIYDVVDSPELMMTSSERLTWVGYSENRIESGDRTAYFQEIRPPTISNAEIVTTSLYSNLVIYKTPGLDRFEVADSVTGRVFDIALPHPYSKIYSAWYIDDVRCVFFVQEEDTDQFEIWLLSTEDQTLEVIASDVQLPMASPWLGTPTMSRNQGLAWFQTASGELYFLRLRPKTVELEQIGQWADQLIANVQWLPYQGQLVAITYSPSEDAAVYLIDPTTNEASLLASLGQKLQIYHATFSSEDEFLILYAIPIEAVPVTSSPNLYIYSFSSGSLDLVASPGFSPDNYMGENFWVEWSHSWPPEQDRWFIVHAQSAQNADEPFIQVVKEDGSTVREINVSCLEAAYSCFGWMPPMPPIPRS
jgi:hypothetical protein